MRRTRIAMAGVVAAALVTVGVVTTTRDRSAATQDHIDTVNQVSGRDLTAFPRAWLFGPTTPPMPGHPDWITK